MILSLVGGVLLYQLGLILSLVLLQTTAPTSDMAQVVQFIALGQLLGALAPLQLQYEMIRTKNTPEAQCEFSTIIAFLGIMGCAIALGLWFFGFDATATLQIAVGSVVFAWSDVQRSFFIREGAKQKQPLPHLILGASFLLAAAAYLTLSDVDVFLFAFCGTALAALLISCPPRKSPSLTALKGLARKGWRFAVYRTPTTALDVMVTRSLVLFMGPLGEAFTNLFFLVMRILIGPFQMVIWAVSQWVYKRTLEVSKTDISGLVVNAWQKCMVLTIPGLWIFGLFIGFFDDPIAKIGRIDMPEALAPICATIAVFVASQCYIGWLGRIFDSYDQQRNIVVFETIMKIIILLAVYRAATSLDTGLFLATYASSYVIFTVGFLCFFCHMQGLSLILGVSRYLIGTIGVGVSGMLFILQMM